MSTTPAAPAAVAALGAVLLLVAADTALAQTVPRSGSDAPVFIQVLALVLGGAFLIGLGAAIFLDNPELIFFGGGAAVGWWLYHYQGYGIAYSALGGFEAIFAATAAADLFLMARGRRPYSRKTAIILFSLLALGAALLVYFR
jgi:hypothetical protein